MQIRSILTIFISLISCGRNPTSNQNRDAISDQAQEPGAVPTAAPSFELMSDPQRRRLVFQDILTTSGHKCRLVTQAVLKIGFEGTDLWQINCVDSGAWVITLTSDSPAQVSSCVTDPKQCDFPSRSN